MKILFTGTAGMLAAEIVPVVMREKHQVVLTDINRRLPDIDALDVTVKEDVLRKVGRMRPDYIFHLAAETDVDLCEKDPDHAFRVNTLGTQNIVSACKDLGVKLVYISTGAVFDGNKPDPYTEFDDPAPVNIYGQSKLQGEVIVTDQLTDYFIIRAGWMVGGWELDKKFVYKIVCQLKEGKKKLMAVEDKSGSPTFTKDFAANILKVINTRRFGLYHMANKGTCTRYDMAVKIVEFMGLTDEVKIEPVGSDKFPLPAPRARSEMMRNYKLDLLGLNNMPHWEESLADYIRINRDK